eukprot:4933665-Lingulodinium_polyedra.AAC.1
MLGPASPCRIASQLLDVVLAAAVVVQAVVVEVVLAAAVVAAQGRRPGRGRCRCCSPGSGRG